MKLIAYQIDDRPVGIRAAAVDRDWMDATPDRYSYRCLPLNIANAYGWEILCQSAFKATWDGEVGLDAIKIDVEPGTTAPAISHFGSGILTFHVPCLFRTEPGFDLMVQGPINRPKDAITPLQGIVETDWSPFTFTMNWKFTQPEIEVEFEKDEPICHFFPLRRGEIERFEPEFLPLSADPDLEAEYRTWSESRRDFNRELKVPGSKAKADKWQKFYYRGAAADFTKLAPAEHRTRLKVKDFRK